LALVLRDLAYECRARCGSGFGTYPLGLREAIERLRPLVPADDPIVPDLDKAIAELKERSSR
jgi:hypothetical protein